MRLHTDRFGSSGLPPLLMIHGLFGSGRLWRGLATNLSEHFWVHTPDLRNHGQSPQGYSMSLATMADDLWEYLHQEGISEVSILGHSLGGKVAMQMALAQPDRVKKLIVEDIAPVHYLPRHQNTFAAIGKLEATRLRSRREADELIQDLIPSTGERQFMLTNLRRDALGLLRWRPDMQAIRDQYDVFSKAPDFLGPPYRGPALFIRGGQSPYVLDEYRDTIEMMFPLSRIHTLKQASHWVHADAPQAFQTMVKRFLMRGDEE
ncbi:esterase YbfF [gamma proteobacterium HTCC5015]|nr:esterase YbfF [gamma proteobacterium HTCC5015]